MESSIVGKAERGQTNRIGMLQRDRRLLRDQDDRTVRGGGAGQRLRRYQLDRNRNVGNLLPGLEPIKANRDGDVFRNAIAGAGKFDQCGVGFFIIRDDLRQTELRYAQSGDIGDIPVNIHIRAQPVARLVLHLGPDADIGAVGECGHRPHLDAVVFHSDAGKALALSGEAAKRVL